MWLDQTSSRLVKAQLKVPVGQSGAAPVTVTLSAFGTPVTVLPPS